MEGLYDQLKIVAHGIWRRRWLALGVAWGLCLAGWLVLSLIPNSYESTAKISVETALLTDRTGAAPVDRQADLRRIQQSLLSTGNLEKVVRRTELNKTVASEADLAAAVTALREDIEVKAEGDNLFLIKATSGRGNLSNGENARLATGIVGGLIDLFREGGLSGDRSRNQLSIKILDEELQRLEGGLRQAEERRVAFETRYMGLLPGEGSIGQRMAAARLELGQIEQQLASAAAALGAARSQLASTPASIQTPNFYAGGGGGAPVDPAAQQLAVLEGQLSQAQARGWTDQHPDVVATRQQIARTRGQVRRGGSGGSRSAPATISSPNPAYSALRTMMAEREGQVSAASGRRQQLLNDLSQLAAKQTSEPGIAAEQARLNRDYEVIKRQYDKLLEDREQLRLTGDVAVKTETMRFNAIDPPSRPTVPATPNRPLLLTLVLLVGLGTGLAAAFAKGQLQTTFPTQKRLAEVTGLPVLGAIGAVVSPARRARERLQLRYLAGAGGGLAAAYALLMLVELAQRSMVA